MRYCNLIGFFEFAPNNAKQNTEHRAWETGTEPHETTKARLQCYRALANTQEPQRNAPLPSAKIRQSFEIAPNFIEKVSNFRKTGYQIAQKERKRGFS